MIQMLAARYKLDQSKIIEQIHEQWRRLKISSTKNKIDSELSSEKIYVYRWSTWI
jgi:hypothetical protein